MEPSAKTKALVAIDLGAQSCRISLLRWKQSNAHVDVVHRFSNTPLSDGGSLLWDIERIFRGIETGLSLCAEIAEEGIAAIGVDGWAVDYVRMRADGSPFANPFCYRDGRTEKAEQEIYRLLPPARLYSLTGIQLLSLNTLYQLYADRQQGMDATVPWLNIPEFITHRLGGEPVAEYTNATHTQLVESGTHKWCQEIFLTTGLDVSAAPKIVPTGSIVGTLRGELASLPAFRAAQLIVPACHDTASAIAAIPAAGNDWAFISSGTWSLVGTVIDSPCITEDAYNMNFTNLGGVGGKTCFLKNVNGMWLLRQCMDEWESQGDFWQVSDLIQQCESLPAPDFLIDVDDTPLKLPGNVLGKINAQLERSGRRPFPLESRSIPRIANVIFHSLAARYAEVFRAIAAITGKKLARLFIVGGGSRNALLNRLTAERTGLEIVLGSPESATIGNFAIQMAALQGEWNDSTGVIASSVAKWANEMSSLPLESSMNHALK